MGSAGCDSSANSSSVKKGPIDVQCSQFTGLSPSNGVPSRNSFTPRKPAKLTRGKKGSSGNTDLFRSGMQALLRRVHVGAASYQFSWCSGIDTFRKVG